MSVSSRGVRKRDVAICDYTDDCHAVQNSGSQ